MPDIKLTKQEMIDLNAGLHGVTHLSGPRFVYVIARNISILKDEINAIQKALEPSEDFLTYDRARVDLARSHAVQENGQPKMYGNPGQERFEIEDQTKFNEDLSKLRETHKVALDARKEQEDAFSSILKEEVDLFLYGLDKDDIPENITAGQLSAILILVQDEKSK